MRRPGRIWPNAAARRVGRCQARPRRPSTFVRNAWITGSRSIHAEASRRAGSRSLGAPAKPSGIWLCSVGGCVDSST